MRYYEYLVAVAAHGHFGKAALECCVTQPTLSLGIKELERQLGFELIHRERRYMGLTEEGEIVVDYAKRILNLRTSLVSRLEQYRDQNNAPLIFGTVPTGLDIVARLATRLSQQNLTQNIVTETVAEEDVDQAVLNMDVDLCLRSADSGSSELETLVELHEEQSWLIVPGGQALSANSISVNDIGDLPICHLPMEWYGKELRDRLAQQSAGARTCAGTVATVTSYLRQQYWYAILPANLLESVRCDKQLRAIPIKTEIAPSKFTIASRPVSSYSGSKIKVLEHVRRAAGEYSCNVARLPGPDSNNLDSKNVVTFKQRSAKSELIETIN